MTIGIFIIATGKYIEFVKPLCEGIDKYFLTKHGKAVYVFTDSGEVPKCAKRVHLGHRPWPYPTLYRYNIISGFCREEGVKHDCYYYFDADMLIVDTVGDEVIGDFTVVKHPGFFHANKNQLYYEKNFLTHAYVNPNKMENYYAGGFNGGRKYLEMAKLISEWNVKDQEHGFTPQWHDETYLNKYAALYRPDVILPPGYCFPQTEKEIKSWGLSGIEPKIVAITKLKGYK